MGVFAQVRGELGVSGGLSPPLKECPNEERPCSIMPFQAYNMAVEPRPSQDLFLDLL